MQLSKHPVLSAAEIFGGAMSDEVTEMRKDYRKILDDVYAIDTEALKLEVEEQKDARGL